MCFNLLKILALVFGWEMALAGLAEANPWESSESGKVIEGVKLSGSLKGTIEGSSLNLKTVGSALRVKKVLFVKAKVYVGELFFSEPEKFKRSKEEALSSIHSAESAAVRLTFLRDVDAKSFRNAFMDGWKENGISEKDPWVINFLQKISLLGELKKGTQLLLVAAKTKNGEVILVDNQQGFSLLLPSKPTDRTTLFSLWLGKASDSGIEDFQKELIK
jgi:hypothetical protein